MVHPVTTNQITGTVTHEINLSTTVYSDPVTIISTATVDNSGGTAIYATGTAWDVVNYGHVIAGSNYGIQLHSGGSVTNESGAVISGSNEAIKMDGGGTVINMAGGTIAGGNIGVKLDNPSDTLMNSGVITASSSFGGTGVYGNEANAIVVNEAGGTIKSTGGVGVQLKGTSATFENAGTVIGGSSMFTGSSNDVYLGANTNRLILDAGAVFTGGNGDVVAKSASANTLELKTGAAVGTVKGLGTIYQNFQTVTIDSGAAWDIAGTKAGVDASTIQGFNSHDRLDLTDLTFNSGDTATVNGSNQLIIDDAGGNVTIQMDSNVSGHLFTLVNDGNGHTFAEETNYTPCYLRGTRIRTPKGQAAVEDLRIGDLIVTADGAVLPIKWIGRRSYRDWLAVGNPEVQPIRFKAGSIADHVPARDLYVSPEHAMFLDGVLIPAHHLMNGVSILKVEGMEEVEYFHLEFDRHVVIFAEDAAAESFVDDDSRMLFHNADEYCRLYTDEPRGRFTEFCAPRVEAGAALEALHRTLATRAARLLPDGTATEALARQGHLDRATRMAIEGWAFAGMDEGPVKLAILVNGAVVGQTVADRYRAGLGFGDGHCSFRFALPEGLSSDVNHRIEVRRESDWTPLTGGCVTLEPEAP
jgi:hypothetical protein